MKLLDTLNDTLLSGLSGSCASVSFAGGEVVDGLNVRFVGLAGGG